MDKQKLAQYEQNTRKFVFAIMIEVIIFVFLFFFFKSPTKYYILVSGIIFVFVTNLLMRLYKTKNKEYEQFLKDRIVYYALAKELVSVIRYLDTDDFNDIINSSTLDYFTDISNETNSEAEKEYEVNLELNYFTILENPEFPSRYEYTDIESISLSSLEEIKKEKMMNYYVNLKNGKKYRAMFFEDAVLKFLAHTKLKAENQEEVLEFFKLMFTIA